MTYRFFQGFVPEAGTSDGMSSCPGITQSTRCTVMACHGTTELRFGRLATTNWTGRGVLSEESCTTEPTACGAPVPTLAPSGTPGQATRWLPREMPVNPAMDTNDEMAAPYSTDALHLARVGQHDCYDRVVLDIDGPADIGYTVHNVPVAGGAAFAVVAHAPPRALDNSGHQHGSQFTGRRSLRAVRYAGYFEGRSTVAIGVRETLPVRVSTQLDGTDNIRRVLIDIAHDR